MNDSRADAAGSVPEYLYKYQRFDPVTLSNLVGRLLWFSRPTAFNDPYDCSIRPTTELSKADCDRLYDWVRSKRGGEKSLAKYRGADGLETFRRQVLQAVEPGLEARRQEMLNRMGVACLSAKKDDLLMWAHYGDSHKGFCLEFSTGYEPFNKAKKVIYQRTIPVVNPATMLLDRTNESMTMVAIMLTKMDCWRYEEEWRLVHEKSDTAFGYGTAALTGIYFGSEMDRKHIEIMALILRDSPTKLYSMRRSDSEFKVIPEELDHTPYDYYKDSHGTSTPAS